ncbi:MAG TPA: hypothetical protein VKE92_09175 [Anaerolineales bacterium]|nr:hypothetical protein [Anaerolineales bacterium]
MEPRSFTRNSLSNILEFDLGKRTNNENLWLAFLHLSSVVNFQSTITLVLFAFTLILIFAPAVWLMVQQLDGNPGILGDIFTLLPPIPILLIGLFTSYQAVMNTVRSLSDKPIRYPLSIPFVR